MVCMREGVHSVTRLYVIDDDNEKPFLLSFSSHPRASARSHGKFAVAEPFGHVAKRPMRGRVRGIGRGGVWPRCIAVLLMMLSRRDVDEDTSNR